MRKYLIGAGALVAVTAAVIAQSVEPKFATDAGVFGPPSEVSRATAKFPVPDRLYPDAPVLQFTKAVAKRDGTLTWGLLSVRADKILSIQSMHPDEILPHLVKNADGTTTEQPSPFAGHTLSLVIFEGAMIDLPEESLVLGDSSVLTATWAHLMGRRSIRLTQSE